MGCVSSKKKLSKADLEFLQDNTEFTKDQIIEWYEGFIVSIFSQLLTFLHEQHYQNYFFFVFRQLINVSVLPTHFFLPLSLLTRDVMHIEI